MPLRKSWRWGESFGLFRGFDRARVDAGEVFFDEVADGRFFVRGAEVDALGRGVAKTVQVRGGEVNGKTARSRATEGR
jgi:hypothetical protein